MAIRGEQFKNTYMPGRPDWLSPEHHTQKGPEHLTKLHKIDTGLSSDWEHDSPVQSGEITTFDINEEPYKGQVSVGERGRGAGQLNIYNDPVPSPQEELVPGTARQGMLFDPYTGTGLPRDPTVSKEQRVAAVDRQLDLRGGGAKQLRETYAKGDTPISEFDRPIKRSPHGDRSGASTMQATEFYEGDDPERLLATRPKVKQGRAEFGAGTYSPRTNTATVDKSYSDRVVDYPTRSMTRPTKDAVSTGTVWNPEWYSGSNRGAGKGLIPAGGKVEDEANHPSITDQILLKSIFHNPETGETLNPHDTTKVSMVDSTRRSHGPGRGAAGQPSWDSGTKQYKHLGRFAPAETEGGWVSSWDTAEALKTLHEAGFQSDLHKGSGRSKDESFVPSGVESGRPKAEVTESEMPSGRIVHNRVFLPTKESEGYLTKPVRGGEIDQYSAQTGRTTYKDITFHKRRTPSETETVERQTRRITNWPSAGTAFHEREHAIDPNIGLRTVNRGDTRGKHKDPVMEGIADAGEDRNIQYANMHEDALNPSINEHRHKDIKGSAWGYNTSSSAWKRDEDRAIYAATRIHSGMSDPNVIPDRVELVKEQHGNFTPPANSALGSYTTMSIHNQDNTDLANDTLLGKLYHEHKHVRDGLDQLGFGRLGAQAAEKHVSRMSQPDPSEQLSLFDE